MDSTFAAGSAAIRSKHLLDEHGAGTVLVQLVRTWRPRMTRPASKTQDGTVTVLKIGEARDKLPQMVSSLESGSSATYVVGRYGKPAAALVSYQRFGPMLVLSLIHICRSRKDME